MDDTTPLRILAFDREAIVKFLAARDSPVSEVELLKYLTGKSYLSESREELYSLHFSLYHALYTLRRHESGRTHYLHLDPMRIRLAQVPGPRECVFYHAVDGRFCGRPAESGGFCGYHAWYERYYANHPLFDPMDDFYLNPENIAFGASGILSKLMRGIIVYSLRRGEVDEALRFFGMTHPSRRLLQKRYYELARLYHPDLINGNDTMMKRLNSFYQVLREIFIV
jgi:hypothetical protein